MMQGRRRGREAASSPVAAAQPELLWSAARVENALARDFTCNAIMFDPFSALVLDYAGGFRDCQRRVLRTVIDPETSFREDPARILRAVRHAARVGDPYLPRADLSVARVKMLCSSWLAEHTWKTRMTHVHELSCALVGIRIIDLASWAARADRETNFLSACENK